MSRKTMSDDMNSTSNMPKKIVLDREFAIIKQLKRTPNKNNKPPFKIGVVHHSLGYVPIPPIKKNLKKKQLKTQSSGSTNNETVSHDQPLSVNIVDSSASIISSSTEIDFHGIHQPTMDTTFNFGYVDCVPQVTSEAETVFEIDRLETVFENFNLVADDDQMSFVDKYRKNLTDVSRDLQTKCNEWNLILKNEANIPHDILTEFSLLNEKISLLTAGKMIQFRELIKNYEEGTERYPPIIEDNVRRFWDLTLIEVKSIFEVFERWQQLQNDNWNKEITSALRSVKAGEKIENMPDVHPNIQLSITEHEAEFTDSNKENVAIICTVCSTSSGTSTPTVLAATSSVLSPIQNQITPLEHTGEKDLTVEHSAKKVEQTFTTPMDNRVCSRKSTAYTETIEKSTPVHCSPRLAARKYSRTPLKCILCD